jgi:hypothetical protein
MAAVSVLDFTRLNDVLERAELASTIERARDGIIASVPYRAMLPIVTELESRVICWNGNVVATS